MQHKRLQGLCTKIGQRIVGNMQINHFHLHVTTRSLCILAPRSSEAGCLFKMRCKKYYAL